jgi:hypothetical protein
MADDEGQKDDRDNSARASKLTAAVARFVDRHVMVDDRSGYYVEGSGWPTGIKPADKSVEYVEDLLVDTFKTYWDKSVRSLGRSDSDSASL